MRSPTSWLRKLGVIAVWIGGISLLAIGSLLSGSPSSLKGDGQETPPAANFRSDRLVAFLLVVISGAASCGAWFLFPRSTDVPDPLRSIEARVTVVDIDRMDVEVSVEPLSSEVSVLTVHLWSDLPPESATAELAMHVRAAPCDELANADRWKNLVDECRRTVKSVLPLRATTRWITLATTDPSRNSLAQFIIPLKLSMSQAGVLTRGSDYVKVLMPSIAAEGSMKGRGFRSRFIYWTDVGSRLEWSGLPPAHVSKYWVVWDYPDGPEEFGRNLSRGANPDLAYSDQVRLFLAGALAGVAGGALIGAIQSIPSRLAPALGRRKRAT